MGVCIQIANLTKAYGSVQAVDDLSLDIEAGEVFGFLGPNGAGKTTTLYMLSGLLRPTSGTVSIFGKELRKNFLEIASRTGVLVEQPAFYEHLSARRNLLIITSLASREANIDRALDRVGLLHVADTKVGKLSRGLKQRLGLAQALVTEPELLLLDEPTNGLDVESTQELLALLRCLADDAKVTIVLSSHMMHEVETLCDRVAIVNQGKLVRCDKTNALLSFDQSQIEVLTDAPEAAAKRLSAEQWVEEVWVEPGRLHVKLREDNPHQLAAYLVGAGYRISGIIPRRRTLREYFLKALNT